MASSTTLEAQSFTNMNPNDLPQEVLPFYKSMQADYTRKTQEAKAQIEEAQARAAAAEQKLNEFLQQMAAVNEYVARLEDANSKWLAYFEEQEQLAKASAAATGQNQSQSPSPSPSQNTQAQGFTAAESRLLNTDIGKFSKEQLAQLDEYFEAKFGKTFQTLASEVDKLGKQMSFKLQLDEVIRQYSKDIPNIDTQRVLEAAVRNNTLDARTALEKAYEAELRELAVQREVEKRLAEQKAAEKTKLVEGVGSILGDHIYTRPEGIFDNYEQATEAALKELRASQT